MHEVYTGSEYSAILAKDYNKYFTYCTLNILNFRLKIYSGNYNELMGCHKTGVQTNNVQRNSNLVVSTGQGHSTSGEN